MYTNVLLNKWLSHELNQGKKEEKIVEGSTEGCVIHLVS